MEEGSTSEHHGELAGVVGVVEPGLVGDVPGVVAPREAHDAIPGLPPHPAKHRTARETQTWEPTQSLPRGCKGWRGLCIKEFGNCLSKECPKEKQC